MNHREMGEIVRTRFELEVCWRKATFQGDDGFHWLMQR